MLYPDWDIKHIPFPEWNGRDTFDKTRKLNQLNAYLDLLDLPLEAKDLIRKAFIKTEIMYKVASFDVRLISGATDRLNSFMGPELYSWSKELSRVWGGDHFILYTSGKTIEDIMTWIDSQCNRMGMTFDEAYKVGLDESRQDSHVHVQAKKYQTKLMAFQGVYEEVIVVREGLTITIGITSNGVFYARYGGRDTGDTDTGSGNSEMNATKNINYLVEALPSFDLRNPPFAIAIQGDDSLIIMKPEFAQFISGRAVKAHSAKLGFKVKVFTASYNVYDMDYCSRYFWPSDDSPTGYCLGPKLGKVLQKIGWSKKTVVDTYQHNRSIALGLKKDVAHIPFLREWFSTIEKLTEGAKEKPLPFDHKLHVRQAHSEGWDTWDFIQYKYDLYETDLIDLENQLATVTSLPWHLDVPWIDRVVAGDYQ